MTFFVMTSDSLVRFRNQAESVARKILDSQFLLALVAVEHLRQRNFWA